MPDPLPQDGMTLEERFFARIAVKNGILSETDLALATRERVASGRPLADVLRARGLLTDAQIQKVREAQAASQVVQLDSLYADVLAQRGLVPRPRIEEAFREQRRRRYKVRLGELLVEKGELSQADHRAALEELSRQVGGHEGLRTHGATAEQRTARAEDLEGSATGPIFVSGSSGSGTPPAPPGAGRGAGAPIPAGALAPPTGRAASSPSASNGAGKVAIPLDSQSDDSGEAPALPPPSRRGRPPKPPSFLDENARALGVTRDSNRSLPAAPASPAQSNDATERLLASALELRLSTAGDGNGLLSGPDRPPPSARANPVAAKPLLGRDGSGSSEGFSPDLYLRRRVRRRRLVLGIVALVALLVALAVAVAAVTAFGHQRALQETLELVKAAEAAPLADQPPLFAKARRRLDGARGFGVGEARAAKLAGRIVAGEACADAQLSLAAGEPAKAQEVIRLALTHEHLAEEDHSRLVTLQARADHDLLVAAGDDALRRTDYRKAVENYRGANDEPRWQKVRTAMLEEVRALEARALETLQRSDREALAAALKQYFEVWNDRSLQGRLDEVDLQIALARARRALADGDPRKAIELASEALRLREGERTALDLRTQAEQRLRIDGILDRARTAEQNARFDEALAAYREALGLVTGPEKAQIEKLVEQVLKRQDRVRNAQLVSHLREEVKKLLLDGAWDAVLPKAKELVELGDPDGKNLATFAGSAKGMVLIPGGAFVMGNDQEKLSSPQRKETLGPYLMDRLEVTNREYSEFVRATQRATPAHWTENLRLHNGELARGENGKPVKTYAGDEADHPVRNVSWLDARAYAQWARKRLPFEAEWEKAARGTDARTWPWGNQTRSRVRLEREPHVQTATAGTSGDDVSPYGLRDMGGNVCEWCEETLQLYPGSTAAPPADAKKRVIRGGSYDTPFAAGRCYARDGGDETRSWPNVGFRCARDVPEWLAAMLR